MSSYCRFLQPEMFDISQVFFYADINRFTHLSYNYHNNTQSAMTWPIIFNSISNHIYEFSKGAKIDLIFPFCKSSSQFSSISSVILCTICLQVSGFFTERIKATNNKPVHLVHENDLFQFSLYYQFSHRITSDHMPGKPCYLLTN